MSSLEAEPIKKININLTKIVEKLRRQGIQIQICKRPNFLKSSNV